MNNDNNALLAGFGDTLRGKGRAAPTVESYVRDATFFLDFLAQTEIDPKRVESGLLGDYMTYLARDKHEKENTVRRSVIGIRQFYRYLQESKIIHESPFDLVAIPERIEKLPDFDEGKVTALIEKVTANILTFHDARNALLVCLAGLDGLKATEIIALQWDDVFLDCEDQASVLIRGTKARTIRLTATTTQAFREYDAFFAHLRSRPELTSAGQMRVFVSFKGRDASVLTPKMSRHGLKFIFYELGKKIGIDHLNSEILRHYAVMQMITQGRSAEEIMDHFGLRRLGNIARHFSKMRKANQ